MELGLPRLLVPELPSNCLSFNIIQYHILTQTTTHTTTHTQRHTQRHTRTQTHSDTHKHTHTKRHTRKDTHMDTHIDTHRATHNDAYSQRHTYSVTQRYTKCNHKAKNTHITKDTECYNLNLLQYILLTTFYINLFTITLIAFDYYSYPLN